MGLVLFAGHLKNPKVALDALSICMNILAWTLMIAVGFNKASSVRVSNELGAGHPRAAKFSVTVILITSFIIGVILSLVLIITRKKYPTVFTTSQDVKELVSALTPVLAASIVVNNVQPVLSGVAVGAGWQAFIAYVNLGCYYVIGLPLGVLMGYKLDVGVKATIAAERIRHWGRPERLRCEAEK